jgi:uncharacterized protein (DUF1501 family)
MTEFQNLYNDGKMNIIQSVGYDQPNFSHFRSMDIWMSGDTTADRRKRAKTGWVGRYLQNEFPGYPDAYPNDDMPHPLAIQLNSAPTLDLQGSIYSMGLAVSDPERVYTFDNPFFDFPLSSTAANKELNFLRVISKKTKIYSDIIRDAYRKARNLAVYPEAQLAYQLKIVARLIKGGLKTKVYTVSLGGFDTHKKQVNAGDTTTGMHARLLKILSGSIDAFQKDMELMQLDDRVLGMTFSEFGRRIKSNASLGTDHGAAAPLIMFGKATKKGILGNSPEIPAAIEVVDNMPFQYDYRSVYASVLEQWFCVSKTEVSKLLLKNYQSLPLIYGGPCGLKEEINDVNNQSGDLVFKIWPNPYTANATIQFSTNGGVTVVQQMNALGQVIRVHTNKEYAAGTYNIDLYNDGLPPGAYFFRLQNGALQKVITVMKAQ